MARVGPGLPTVALEKATLVVVVGKGLRKTKLKFQYNPEHYTLVKSAEWKAPDQSSGKSTAEPTFTKTNPATVTMDVFFDAFGELSGDVTDDVQTLMAWTKPCPEPNEGTTNQYQPPVLEFRWGASDALDGFRGFLRSVTAQYTMFRSDGTPIRATCNITLEEVASSTWPQNPTSGGKPGLQAHVLIEGETLHSVAWAEYGNASYWRAVAALNHIDDPMRISPGTRLLLPSPRDAGRMS